MACPIFYPNQDKLGNLGQPWTVQDELEESVVIDIIMPK